MARNDDDDDDDDFDYKPASRRSSRSGGFGDYLAFRKMIVPIVIQIIFWVVSGLVAIGGVVFAISTFAQKDGQPFIGILILFIGVPFYVFLIRIYCELLIVIFRMNDTLTDIKNALESRSR